MVFIYEADTLVFCIKECDTIKWASFVSEAKHNERDKWFLEFPSKLAELQYESVVIVNMCEVCM